jgi:hypothetical protein
VNQLVRTYWFAPRRLPILIFSLLILALWIYDVRNHSFIVLGQISLPIYAIILGLGGVFGFYISHLIFCAPNKPFERGNAIIYPFSGFCFAVLFSAAFYSTFWNLAGLYVQSRTEDRQQLSYFAISNVARNRSGPLIILRGGGNRRGISVDENVYDLVSHTINRDKSGRAVCVQLLSSSIGSFTNVSTTVLGKEPKIKDIRQC